MNCAVHTQTQAAAYCRTCGKALCENCKREVMGASIVNRASLHGCKAMRLPEHRYRLRHGQSAGSADPVFAGLLGFIPGVGAMYNGQFTKAFAHVVIFVLLIVATNNISGILES